MSDKLKAALRHVTEQAETMDDTKAAYMAGYIEGMLKGGEIKAAPEADPAASELSARTR